MNYKTEQEKFWDNYISRNESDEYLASNLNFFTQAMYQTGRPDSIIEFGANIGMNLSAIKLLYPSIETYGVEINKKAAKELEQLIGSDNVSNESIFDFNVTKQYDIALIKGVLIHINPEMLNIVYEKLYSTSSRYILLCEYYNPSPVSVKYRGNDEKLFKRDFAGEMLDLYSDLKLVDYGFSYKRDRAFPQDDITWFLLEKG